MRLPLAALMLLGSCVHASRSVDPELWVDARTRHFALRSDLQAEDATRAAADLEVVRAAILASGWFPGIDPKGTDAVIELASAHELREFAGEEIGGFVTRDLYGEPLMVISAQDGIVDQTIVKHELAHVVNGAMLMSRPRWVDEGLACYFETMRVNRAKRRVTLGEADSDRLAFIKYNKISSFFVTVINVGRMAEDMSAYSGYFYETGAWLVVHWMIDVRPKQFRAYLQRLAKGENAWIAFGAAFPDLNEERLRDEIWRWYGNWGSGLKTATVELPEADETVQMRKTGAAEVFATRAELFALAPNVKVGREERKGKRDAEIQRALAIDPGQPLALALLDSSDGKAATAAHPDDWRAWLLVHDRNHQDRAAIEKAMTLAPENASVLARLAFSDQKAGKPKEAVQHALHAVEIAPGRFEVLDALAAVLAANGQCEPALRMAERALEAVPDSASSGVPAALRQRLWAIQNKCR